MMLMMFSDSIQMLKTWNFVSIWTEQIDDDMALSLSLFLIPTSSHLPLWLLLLYIYSCSSLNGMENDNNNNTDWAYCAARFQIWNFCGAVQILRHKIYTKSKEMKIRIDVSMYLYIYLCIDALKGFCISDKPAGNAQSCVPPLRKRYIAFELKYLKQNVAAI